VLFRVLTGKMMQASSEDEVISTATGSDFLAALWEALPSDTSSWSATGGCFPN
jgi:hypothetical protein